MPEPTVSAAEWCEKFAAAIGTAPPSPDEVEALLGLAGVAAHGSERIAAPLSCWLAGRAGADLDEALATARRLAGEDQPG